MERAGTDHRGFALKNGLITVVKASLTSSIIGNLLLTLGLAMFAGGLMSEILTNSLEPATQQLRISDVFAGIILLASVSNISGMMNAVVSARKNQMDLAASSVIGAATQIATSGRPRPGTGEMLSIGFYYAK